MPTQAVPPEPTGANFGDRSAAKRRAERLAAYDVSVNVVFLGGSDFDSPPPLVTTDRTRNIQVTTLADAQRSELLQWINEASRTPGRS